MKWMGRLLGASACCLALLASCAKDDGATADYESISLQAWMRLHKPELLENLQEEGGYYVDVHEVGDMDAAPVNDTVCWVKFDFSGRDLNGNIVLTRNEREARLAGTYTRQTHYAPYYRYCGEENTSLLEGTYLAMRNTLTLGKTYAAEHDLPETLLLREGSKVTLYMPSSIVSTSGVSGDGGYGGQSGYELDAGRPFVVTLEIRDTIKNPLEREGSEVDAFAERNGTLKPVEEDSEDSEDSSTVSAQLRARRLTARLTRGAEESQYNDGFAWRNAVDTIPQLYVHHTYNPKTTKYAYSDPYQSVYEPYNNFEKLEQDIADTLYNRFGEGVLTGDSVTLDGTAKIWYICRLLDGFVVDTNIDGVKRLVYGEVQSEGEALEYSPESDQTSLIQAWYYSVPQLRFGQWASILTTSSYAYGSTGQTGTTSSSTTSSSSYYSSYYDYLNYYNYYNSYYGNSYYGGYYNNYYNNYYGGYYNSYYYDYYNSYDSSTTETVYTTTTEIPPFTPLLFQIYIEPEDE